MRRLGRWSLALLIVAAIGWAAWWATRAPVAAPAVTAARASIEPDSAPSLARPVVKRAPPRLAPPMLEAPGAAAALPIEGEMPAGLRADLAMFNDDQLRAELDSVALSLPAVRIISARCPRLPCAATAVSADVQSLNAFVEQVASRFSGHVSTEFADGDGEVVAALVIGTTQRYSVARYAPAAP